MRRVAKTLMSISTGGGARQVAGAVFSDTVQLIKESSTSSGMQPQQKKNMSTVMVMLIPTSN